MKVKKRDSQPPLSEQDLLEEWKDCVSSLLNNDSGFASSEIPPPADEDLPTPTDSPTCKETAKAIAAMKVNKAAALDWIVPLLLKLFREVATR